MVRRLETNGKEICDQTKMKDGIKIFFKEIFKYKGKSFTSLSNILNSVDLPCLTNEQKDSCNTELWEKELCNALKSIPNNKTSGNDALSKEFYEAFWKELKYPILKSFHEDKSLRQTAYVQNRYIGEAGRLISDILDIDDRS